ncbi:Lariat debranching enzyme [Penicillium cataractarum]|uniref:Lariat debranching enzyme n=1 Tax=Penicillium cataractarum TaxID=2100454 RepID=A0A9W9V8D5_9EURO|nr:Lariat debranching enzyme [Penicillium cataractarum]KAJ5371364.1 Lariat debranching enzyme [Penicillium cataractarum]
MLSEIDGVRVAVVGCAHGGFDEIYTLLKARAEEKGWETIDLVIIGGDFQALRNANDAACISVPAKWKSMGDFYKYYGGEAVAPYLTIFCGGNHEASNYMYELYYGGWAAPNIYYLGAANIVRFGPLRISAMSGIWKGYDFRKPHFERLPYNADDLHSVYHIRELDVRKLLQVRTQVDIGLSHDWPRGIEYSGDHRELFRKKRGFREDSEHGRLGNAAARDVLDRLRPAYWFSAHLHVKFAAALAHDGTTLAKIPFPADQPAVWAVEAQAPVVSPKAASKTMVSSSVKSPSPPPNTTSNTGPAPMVSNKVLRASGTAQEKLQAWNDFAQGGAQEFERQERRVMEQEWMETIRRQDERRAGSKDQPSEGNVGQPTLGQNQDEIDLDSSSESDKSGSGNPSPTKAPRLDISASDGSNNNETAAEGPLVDRAVTEGLRSKLPASFARPAASAESTQKKLETADITNKLTRFLALDKPHNRDDFLHLVKINPIKSTDAHASPETFRLEYDKEWLAITRVFANDLVLGDATAQVPANKGEEYYRARILEEEEWVEKHIVDEWRMQVPYNFQPSAPNFDPDVPLTTTEQPMEYTNSQTTEFCKLLDIPNKFDLTESEREARMNAGPRASGAGHGGRGRGGGRGGSRRGGARRGPGRGPSRGMGRGGARCGDFNASW